MVEGKKGLKPDWERNVVVVGEELWRREPDFVGMLKSLVIGTGYGFEVLADVRGEKGIWLRDWMPLIGRGFVVRYGSDYDDGSGLLWEHLVEGIERRSFSFWYEGGNIATDGELSVCCEVLDEYAGNDVTDEWERITSTKLVRIPVERGDEIGHADGYVRFVSEGVVALSALSDRSLMSDMVQRLEEGGVRSIVEVPYLAKQEGIDAWGVYVNWLAVGNLIVLPSFDESEDSKLVRLLESMDREVRLINVPKSITDDGGVLNCCTWTC